MGDYSLCGAKGYSVGLLLLRNGSQTANEYSNVERGRDGPLENGVGSPVVPYAAYIKVRKYR